MIQTLRPIGQVWDGTGASGQPANIFLTKVEGDPDFVV